MYSWECPNCNEQNVDTRKHFVLCVHCGKTYITIPGKGVDSSPDGQERDLKNMVARPSTKRRRSS